MPDINLYRGAASPYDITLRTLMSDPVLLEDFENIGDWTSGGDAGGAVIQDSTYFQHGSKSFKFTAPTGGGYFATRSINVNFSQTSTFALWVYVPTDTDVANLYSVSIYLTANAFADYFLANPVQVYHLGWNRILLERGDFTSSGSPSWSSTMTTLRIRANAGAGAADVYVDKLEYSTLARPQVMFTFDDGWDSQYNEAYSYLNGAGLRGTVYVIGSKIDTTNYMTTANLNTLYAADWDLSTHGLTDLTTLLIGAAQTDVESNRDWLTGNGFTRRGAYLHYAYPEGGYNSAIVAMLDSIGMLSARNIVDRVQSTEIDEALNLTRRGIFNTTTLAVAKGYIDKLLRTGGTLLLNFHRLVTTPTVDTEWAIADFQALVDYVVGYQTGDALDVITISDLIPFTGAPVTGAGAVVSVEVNTGAGQVNSALTGAGDLAASEVNTGAGQLSLSGAGNVTASEVNTGAGRVTLNGAGSLTAVEVNTGAGQITLNGAGNVTGVEVNTGAAQLTLNGAGSVVSTETNTGAGQLSLSGAGNVNSVEVNTGAGQLGSALSGAGDLTAREVNTGAGQLSLSGAGNLAASEVNAGAGRVTLNGAGDVTANEVNTGAGRLTLNGAGSVVSTETNTGAGQLTLNGAGSINGVEVNTGAGQVSTSLTGAGNLTAGEVNTGAGRVSLQGAGSLSSSESNVGAGHLDLYGGGAVASAVVMSGSGQVSQRGAGSVVAVETNSGAGNVEVIPFVRVRHPFQADGSDGYKPQGHPAYQPAGEGDYKPRGKRSYQPAGKLPYKV